MTLPKLREQLAQFHAAITGAAELGSAAELITGDLAGLRVYEYAYTARIAGVLAHDYPKLAARVGRAQLHAWTAPYLRAHPPSSFTLREVGAHLPTWLPDEHRDLARLERARLEVFDGPDAEPLATSDLAELDPAEFPTLRLQLVPSSRIVALTSTADDVWDALEDEREPPPLVAAERTLLVWRRDVTVVHRQLEADEARAIHALAEGTTFGTACELLGVTDDEAGAARAIGLLVRWLDAAILVK